MIIKSSLVLFALTLHGLLAVQNSKQELSGIALEVE